MSYRVKWKNLNVSLNSVGYHRQHGRNPGGFICIFLRVFFLYFSQIYNVLLIFPYLVGSVSLLPTISCVYMLKC